jgi:hypothetical protein
MPARHAISTSLQQTWAVLRHVHRWLATAARISLSALRRATIATLYATERTLLSARGRERTHATAVFTLIFAFAVTSVDFLVTGGPDWEPAPQQRAEQTEPAQAVATSAPMPATAAPTSATIQEIAFDDYVEGLDASALLGGPGATVLRVSSRLPRPLPIEVTSRLEAEPIAAEAPAPEKAKPTRS